MSAAAQSVCVMPSRMLVEARVLPGSPINSKAWTGRAATQPRLRAIPAGVLRSESRLSENLNNGDADEQKHDAAEAQSGRSDAWADGTNHSDPQTAMRSADRRP